MVMDVSSSRPRGIWVCSALVVAIGLGSAMPAGADERPFVYTYQATTQPAGAREYEQWVTWKTNKDDDSKYDKIEFRHELEFGLTDRLTLDLYLSDWNYEDGRSVDDDGTDWTNVAASLRYNVLHPNEAPIGLTLYNEIKAGDEKLAYEGIVIVQKNFGPFIAAYNFVFEPEWEGDRLEEDKLELKNTAGLSYQVSPSFLVGAEMVHEIEYEDWAEWTDHVVYVGPNASYRSKGWWVTAAPLFQVTDVEDEANFQVRMIVGIDF